MDVHDQLNQLAATVRAAKTMPMSASCLVNRAAMLDVLERLQDGLPANLDHAEALLSDRDAVLAAGREQAERILDGARAERDQLIEQTDVLVAARARAFTVVTEARAESTRLLADADDYVNRKLAEFEMVLGQLQSQVNNGRQRLTARREADLVRAKGAAQGSQHGENARLDGLPEPSTTSVVEAVDHLGAGAAAASVGAR
jgi:vacuolar-type H+-ATPase subunit H